MVSMGGNLLYCWSDGLGMVSWADKPSGLHAVFGAGGFLLIGGMFLFRFSLGRRVTGDHNIINPSQLFRRNLNRRRGRGLVTVGAMAAGTFLVVSTGAFRKAPDVGHDNFKSGTGGFSFWGESASPIYDDLNGREAAELLI